jgi:hypothetical protein
MAKSKSQPTLIGLPWNFVTVWNQCLDNVQDRPVVPRNYIYASELGQSFISRYLKMNAVVPTNPPNERSRRKFQAGNLWEWVVGMVLISAGLMKKKQLRVETELKGLLRVSGRLDFVVGGAFDYDAAKKKITEIKDSLLLLDLELPPFFFTAIDKFVDDNKGKLLREVVFECKSVGSYMMEKVQKSGAMHHHVLQDFHYVYGNEDQVQEGKVCYIDRDSCLMAEFDVLNNEENFKLYKNDIKQMTEHYNKGFDKKNPLRLAPPKDPHILFEEGTWRFTKNFNVEYSNYLTMIYGFETPEDFRNSCQSKIAAWSRAFRRYVLEGTVIKTKVKGEVKYTICTVTDSNKSKRDECIKEGFDWDKYVKAARKDNAFVDKQDENEDE